MSGTFFDIRFSSSVLLLVLAALLVSSGCRWLAPRQSPAQPPSPEVRVVSAPLPNNTASDNAVEPDRYSAFRPIIAEPFVQPSNVVPVQSLPEPENKNEPPKDETKPNAAAQLIIEELNRKVTELESQLAETKQPPSVIEETILEKETENTKITKLPMINRQGVTVSSDELHRVRIEVMDKVLFLPNAWQLTAEGEETLRTIAAEIRAFDSKVDLDIEGHTDSLMRDPRNPMQQHDISSVKAKAVMDFFVNTLRWDASRIGSSSFGRSRPVADNGTPEGRDKNNRIEVVLRNKTK